jgi:dihydrofolate reductase
LNFIVVVDQNYGIGYKDKLLTHIPEDLKYFKKMTLGKVIIMGRTTLEALPGGKTLPGRTTIVITNNLDYHFKGVVVAHGLEELFEILKPYRDEDIFVAGGETIYNLLLPYCEYGYVTHIKAEFEADKHLACIEQLAEWEKIWDSEESSHNGIFFSFHKYINHQVVDWRKF